MGVPSCSVGGGCDGLEGGLGGAWWSGHISSVIYIGKTRVY